MENSKDENFKTLKKILKDWNIHSITFRKIYTDIKGTQNIINDYCKRKKIDILIGTSIGAFYVLQYKGVINKLVINPCMYPSNEIPKLNVKVSGKRIILSEEVLTDFRKMEKYGNISEEQKLRTFGIFEKENISFQFYDSFEKIFCYKECKIPNNILINKHPNIVKEYFAKGLQRAKNYFEDIPMTYAQIELTHQLIKSNKEVDNYITCFNRHLEELTYMVTKGSIGDEYYSFSKALREDFDSWAITNEPDSILIVDCLNTIKTCIQKNKYFYTQELAYSSEFEELLNHFYTVMEDLYFRKILASFSTTINPEDIPELNLPCKVLCGCTPNWGKELFYLDYGSSSVYVNVIRFCDPRTKKYFSMTIANCSCILENRENCSLSDEQLDIIKNYIHANIGIILLHNTGIIDSQTFFAALKMKVNPDEYIPEIGNPSTLLPSKKYYIHMDDVNMEDWCYEKSQSIALTFEKNSSFGISISTGSSTILHL